MQVWLQQETSLQLQGRDRHEQVASALVCQGLFLYVASGRGHA